MFTKNPIAFLFQATFGVAVLPAALLSKLTAAMAAVLTAAGRAAPAAGAIAALYKTSEEINCALLKRITVEIQSNPWSPLRSYFRAVVATNRSEVNSKAMVDAFWGVAEILFKEEVAKTLLTREDFLEFWNELQEEASTQMEADIPKGGWAVIKGLARRARQHASDEMKFRFVFTPQDESADSLN